MSVEVSTTELILGSFGILNILEMLWIVKKLSVAYLLIYKRPLTVNHEIILQILNYYGIYEWLV